MATIKLDLNKFKASGIYTLEFDQSESILVSPQTIRLVVGFSKRGPFNAPVFCPDVKTARTVFGDIDTSLERKGSFFHRSLFTALQTGPCFALNLLALNDDQESSPDSSDKVNYRSFSLDTAETNGTLTPRLLSSFFNKQKFWFPDSEFFLATLSTNDEHKLFHITNLGQTPMSVIVRKSATKGYDLTASEWYNNLKQDKPSFLNDADYISDFFVDVVAVQGNWTDYAALSIDPFYSTYFNAKGFKKGKLDAFTSLPEVSLVASITGCIIPDFTDANGSNQSIETLINNTTAVTGLFCAINREALDDIENNESQLDLVGHNLIAALEADQAEINLISYKAPLINDFAYADVSPSYVDYQSPYNVLIAYEGSTIYTDWKSGTITDGDYIIKNGGGTKQYLKFFGPQSDVNGDLFVEVRAYDSDEFTFQESVAAFGTTYDTAGDLVSNDLNIVSLYGNYNRFFTTIVADPMLPITSNEFIVNSTDAKLMNIADLIVDSTGARLTRIVKKAAYDGTGNVKITCNQAIKLYSSNRVQKFQKLQDFVQEYQYTYLQGFTLRETHMPNGSDTRRNDIMNVMYDTNIATSLANKDVITWRYVIDTFSGGIEPNCKNAITRLAKLRQKAIALCNAPSMKQFAESTDPVFTSQPTASDPKPLLNTTYIVEGGNQSLSPSFSFSLSDEDNGSKYAGYFAPFIVLRDNNKNINVPPSAHVSNNFVQKFLNGTPFSIVAGPRRGIISDPNLVGVEYDFTDGDRENLEPFGINPIIRRRGVGIMIFANSTGYVRVNSALNNLHVRDMLITIEEDIETILSNYLFEFNDPSIRLEIKAKVDSYLEGVQSAGGIFNFTTIMDTSNNTNEVIDQNIGIIDVIVEPARGIHKFLNRVTITKTGAISSGGFTIA